MHGAIAALPAKFPTSAPRMARLRYVERGQEIGLLDEVVEQSFPFDQLGRRVKFGHSALVQYDDLVRVQNGIDAMRYGNDGLVLEHVATQRCLQHGVRLHIYSGLFHSSVHSAQQTKVS